jgi:hypothetical protein
MTRFVNFNLIPQSVTCNLPNLYFSYFITHIMLIGIVYFEILTHVGNYRTNLIVTNQSSSYSHLMLCMHRMYILRC